MIMVDVGELFKAKYAPTEGQQLAPQLFCLEQNMVMLCSLKPE